MILYETSRIENFSISLLLSRGCSALLCIAFFSGFYRFINREFVRSFTVTARLRLESA